MGAEVDGQFGTIAAPMKKKQEVIGFTLWLLGQGMPRVKGTLMVLGRLVRCFEFRRHLMSLLRDCWPKVGPHVRQPLKSETIRSLVRASVMLPMAYSDLRSQVSAERWLPGHSVDALPSCRRHAICSSSRPPYICALTFRWGRQSCVLCHGCRAK